MLQNAPSVFLLLAGLRGVFFNWVGGAGEVIFGNAGTMPHPKEDRFEGGSVNYEPERWWATHAKTPEVS